MAEKKLIISNPTTSTFLGPTLPESGISCIRLETDTGEQLNIKPKEDHPEIYIDTIAKRLRVWRISPCGIELHQEFDLHQITRITTYS